MLLVLEHHPLETVYLAVALVDLYRGVLDGRDGPLPFKSFTDYVCESVLDHDDEYVLKERYLAPPKRFRPQHERVREIDCEPPLAQGENSEGLMRLVSARMLSDSQHHNNHRVKAACYDEERRQFIVLDSLSHKIDVYGMGCEKVGEVSTPDRGERGIVIDICFSVRQQRVQQHCAPHLTCRSGPP